LSAHGDGADRRERRARPAAPRPRAPIPTRAARTRAPRGVNRQRIAEHLRDAEPGAASKIAKGTRIKRGVVYDNLGKLVQAGEVEQRDQDGTAVFALAAAPARDPAG